MARKMNKPEHPDDMRLVEEMRNSVEQIWQAGLGAFAKAQQEGEDMFSRLVEEGVDVQRRTQKIAEEKLSGLTETVAKLAGNVGRQASDSREKLENVFEERVSRSLRNLGIPTRDDIAALTEQIDELQNLVNALVAQKGNGKSTGGKSPAKTAKSEAAPKATTATKGTAAKRTAQSSTKKRAGTGTRRV